MRGFRHYARRTDVVAPPRADSAARSGAVCGRRTVAWLSSAATAASVSAIAAVAVGADAANHPLRGSPPRRLPHRSARLLLACTKTDRVRPTRFRRRRLRRSTPTETRLVRAHLVATTTNHASSSSRYGTLASRVHRWHHAGNSIGGPDGHRLVCRRVLLNCAANTASGGAAVASTRLAHPCTRAVSTGRRRPSR